MPHPGRLGPAPPDLLGAECAGKPPELWQGDDPHDPFVRAGIALCGRCPVKVECGLHALENVEHGIWGGMTKPQRDRLRARLRRVDALV